MRTTTSPSIRTGAFDAVVLSRTLQAVERPREVLRQMLRIGRNAIVSFPNFGHWLMRWRLLVRGRMPDTETWNRPWYETPNIHPCTIADFFALCEQEGYVVEEWLAVDEHGQRAPWRRSRRLANLFGEQALFKLRRGVAAVRTKCGEEEGVGAERGHSQRPGRSPCGLGLPHCRR